MCFFVYMAAVGSVKASVYAWLRIKSWRGVSLKLSMMTVNWVLEYNVLCGMWMCRMGYLCLGVEV